MMAVTVTTDTVWEDTDAVFMARITNWAAANITIATVTSITRYIYDETGGTTIDSGTAVTVATSVFDTLQTDALWSKDSTGYNFKDTIGETAFVTGGSTYRVEYIVKPTSGTEFPVAFQVTAKALRSS